ncbi:hypothetical protein HMPREF9278_2142 [Mobiluncus mulieris FB024-16]|uniref:hypothetical protein n=1 Tax=Mobiluncus mulieris TaxID=2052 RepID=UPI0001E51BCF|nr:hypothetical protein [Mobiluncus mulieris]EFN92224.1 hypothetical protein HMPREF9278_2142 [Mobiluncus mulieris FB024-16]
MASEIRDYLLAWARTRVSVCTNHEAGVEILGSVLGVLAGQSAEITADASRETPDLGNGEHG